VGSGNSPAQSPTRASGSTVLYHCCQENRACWLASSVTVEQQESWYLLIQGHWFPWYFRVKALGHALRGSVEVGVPVCVRK
jgi:hypothetical protein